MATDDALPCLRLIRCQLAQSLAQLLLDDGYPRAALRGFAAALARKPIPRYELAILGGAACAAAAALPCVAARTLVRNFSERVDALVVADATCNTAPRNPLQVPMTISYLAAQPLTSR